MKLIPWKAQRTFARPSDLFGSFDADLNHVFESFFSPEISAGQRWLPSLDLKEDAQGLSVNVDLPGLEKKDIQLSVEDGVLSITGERKYEEAKEEGGWQRVERSYGSFRRTITLPSSVDPNSVKAEYKDGVLKLRLAKSEAAKPKAITID
jgi:HSP20 family protein